MTKKHMGGSLNRFFLVASIGALTQSAPWCSLSANQSRGSVESQTIRSDADLQKAVEARLTLEPRVNSANILVSAKDGVVTLSGMVDNLLDKEQASQYVKDVKGVRAVNENLGVRKVERTDAEIQKEITRSLTINPTVNAADIKINVKDSVVALSGTVDSKKAREQANNAAKNVDGVKKVVDDIQVAQSDQSRHTDQQ